MVTTRNEEEEEEEELYDVLRSICVVVSHHIP